MFSGMDVDAVEAVSKSLKQSAGSLKTLTGDIGREVGRLSGTWEGADARQFADEWWPKHRATLDAITKAIEGLGQSAWNNAQEQRTASVGLRGNAVGNGSSGAASAVTSGSPQPCRESDYTPEQTQEYERLLAMFKLGLKIKGDTMDGGDLIAALRAGTIDYKSFAKWLGDVKGLNAFALFDLVGLGISSVDFGVALGEGNAAKQLDSGLEIVMGAAGIVVPGAGLAYDFGKMLGETGYNSLQQIYDSPGSALDYAARSVYGEHATFDNLTQDQRDVLMERYEGWPGLAATVGDSVGGAWYDFWHLVTTGQGRGPAGTTYSSGGSGW